VEGLGCGGKNDLLCSHPLEPAPMSLSQNASVWGSCSGSPRTDSRSELMRDVVGCRWLVIGQEQRISSKMQVVSCKGKTIDRIEGKWKPSDQNHII